MPLACTAHAGASVHVAALFIYFMLDARDGSNRSILSSNFPIEFCADRLPSAREIENKSNPRETNCEAAFRR